MWSYLSRRRINNKNVHHDKDSFGSMEDVANFTKNYKIVNQLPARSMLLPWPVAPAPTVVNLMIPNTTKCPDFLKRAVEQNSKLITFKQLDYARDHHHFDVKTSKGVSQLIAKTINKFDN